MGIEYRDSGSELTENDLRGFFVGWPTPPTPATHLQVLRESDHVAVAIDTESKALVGFITAISDGVLTAYIPLLEVLPEYQERGIGKELARRMFARLEHLYAVDVICDDDLVPFWQQFGLQPGTGMVRRSRTRT